MERRVEIRVLLVGDEHQASAMELIRRKVEGLDSRIEVLNANGQSDVLGIISDGSVDIVLFVSEVHGHRAVNLAQQIIELLPEVVIYTDTANSRIDKELLVVGAMEIIGDRSTVNFLVQKARKIIDAKAQAAAACRG